ncbi:MAG: hypothetical protein LBJ12_06940, partial [Oscillospiraceae bacterium]|nr:hypothetical protein [Oscillospiraceae bacterium]
YPRIDNLQKLADYFRVAKSDITEEQSKVTVANEQFNIYLSRHEKEVIFAYRSQQEMQTAVDRLLGLEQEESQGLRAG